MRRMSTMYLIILVLSLASIIDTFPTNSHRFNSKRKGPYKVYRIYPNSTRELQSCIELWKSASLYQINFWKEPSRVAAPIDIMVPPHRQAFFEALLSEKHLDYILTIRDVQKLIEERERPVSVSKMHPEFRQLLRDEGESSRTNERVPFFDFRRYHSYEDMRIYMRAIERRYPDWAKVYNLGFTHEGRPIEMIKIGYPLTGRGKKSIWIDAGIHAREWASSTTAMYFIHQLATKTSRDPQMNQYVRELTWYITPVLNPDGYEFTRSSTDPEIRMWRKNRSPNAESCTSSSQRCCVGVDLNRNFDFHWGETGASDSPCEEIYQGSAPFSEPESRAVRDFVLAHKNDIQAVITMHTYSQIWVHPFGHQRFSYPPDVDDLRETGTKAVAALEKLYGTKYKVGSGADTLYPAAGGSDDWSKSKAGIKFVYLLELRPEENVWDGFILDADQILPTARETWEGVKVVVNNVLKRIGIEPISDDPNPVPTAQETEPKQSPPFSSHRRASSRFEQRARIEGNDRSPSTPDELDSSFSIITAVTPDSVEVDISTPNYLINNLPNEFQSISIPLVPGIDPSSSSTITSSTLSSISIQPIDFDLKSTTTSTNIPSLTSVSNSIVSSVSPILDYNTTRTTIVVSSTQTTVSISSIDSTSSPSTSGYNIPAHNSTVSIDPNASSPASSLDLLTTPPIITPSVSMDLIGSLIANQTPNPDYFLDNDTSSEEFLSNSSSDKDTFEPLIDTHRRRLIYVKVSNSSSRYRLSRKKPEKLLETTNTNSSDISNVCQDSMGETRCSRWVNLRDGICERLAHYMRQKCAKTCQFCTL